MGRRNGTLKYQVTQKYKSMLAIGNSRDIEKQNNNGKSNYIHSYNTLKAYTKASIGFADFCKKNYSCKTLEQCEKYCNEYIQHRRFIDRVSPFTQKMERSALSKLFQKDLTHIGTDSRSRANITRSRNETSNDSHFSVKKHEELISFCKSVGLRRAELQYLDNTCLRYHDNKTFVYVSNGKNGKTREVEVIGTKEQITLVADKIKKYP